MYVFPIPRAEKIALGRVLVRWYFSLSLPGLTNETFLGVSRDNLSIFSVTKSPLLRCTIFGSVFIFDTMGFQKGIMQWWNMRLIIGISSSRKSEAGSISISVKCWSCFFREPSFTLHFFYSFSLRIYIFLIQTASSKCKNHKLRKAVVIAKCITAVLSHDWARSYV